ncbi:MAG: hypothetical protein IJY24_03040 [Clostridia bacterium]|nr:hypothetical protein [Clostridia bacterium]
MHAAREAGDGAVILMRRDYIYTDDISYPNIGNNAGERVLDLGGYTIYDRHTYSGGLFSLIAKSSNKSTSLVVENGSIYLTGSPLISFGEFNSSVDGVRHSILLRDLYIGLEAGATTKYLLASRANPTLDIKYSITLESCTLDYTGASSGMTLVALGSKEGALTVEADGCRFVTENAIDSESIIPKMNMTLYNSFVYNVYIPVRSSISYITLDGVMYSELSELSLRLVDGEMHYVLSLPVAVNRAGLEVELCVAITLDSGVVAKGSWQISAVKHLGDLTGTGNDTATALAKDALAYIRSAYLYDKEGDEAEAQIVVSLIDEIIGEDWIASSQPDTTLPKADSTDGVYSVAMKLGAEAAFLLYLDDGYNVGDFDIRVGDYSPRTEVCNDGERVYIKVDLYAYQMTETVEYSIKGTDISGEYNIRAYYDFALDYGDQELVDLVTRLWSYSERARAYRDECLAGEGE